MTASVRNASAGGLAARIGSGHWPLKDNIHFAFIMKMGLETTFLFRYNDSVKDYVFRITGERNEYKYVTGK